MKTFNAGTGKTIVCPNPNASANSIAFRVIGLLLTTLMTFGFFASTAHCQGTVQKPLTDFFHGTHFIRMSGDTMRFEFVLGSDDAPAMDVVGFEIMASFPALNTLPSQVLVSTAGTWISDKAANTSMPTTFDSQVRQLTSSYLRTDAAPQTGQGRVATIALVRPGGFASSEAVMKLDGGLIIVDNVDLRIGQFPGNPSSEGNAIQFIEMGDNDPIGKGLLIYPSAIPNQLNVDIANPEGSELHLTTISGTIVRHQPATAAQQLDVNGLSAGIYIISIHSETRFVSQKVFIP